MNIHWFPGHMTKSLRMMEQNVKLVDLAIYCLDARAPLSCLNPEFESLFYGKPCLYILNKSDLANAAKTDEFKTYFARKGMKVIDVCCTKKTDAARIISALSQISLPQIERLRAKNVFKPVRAMVIGVPNCGKSTLINCLTPHKVAATGDRPGITRSKQWVRLDGGLELLDTPGVLWPKFSAAQTAENLAFIGSIRDEIVDTIEVSCGLILRLQNIAPNSLCNRFGINTELGTANDIQSALRFLEAICRKRGILASGGVCDLERGAKALLTDFRNGKLGRITLDLLPE